MRCYFVMFNCLTFSYRVTIFIIEDKMVNKKKMIDQEIENKFDQAISDSQDVLDIMAEKALKEIAEGKAEEMDWNEL